MKQIEEMTFAEIKQELEESRIPKVQKLYGFKVEELIVVAQLLRNKYYTEESFEIDFTNFTKAYNLGFQEAEKIIEEVVKNSMKIGEKVEVPRKSKKWPPTTPPCERG